MNTSGLLIVHVISQKKAERKITWYTNTIRTHTEIHHVLPGDRQKNHNKHCLFAQLRIFQVRNNQS